ncbi:6-cysteine protein, putative [Plasmodium ovale]|uniref:6-cysteine protein, putative n=1 Tax=Plasmodium ovale TaxID=36330 RepID=A0A1D3U937_PLAOA|nr:6-cysteine protein, putative [Plasmodium ovale]
MFRVRNAIVRIFAILVICVKQDLCKKHVDLTSANKTTFLLNVAPGDTVVFTCPYNFNKEMNNMCAKERQHFEKRQFCFENILINRNVLALRDYVRGAYNLVSGYVNNVYTAEFTVPPVTLMNRHFECYCYIEENNNVVRKILKVHISKGMVRKIPGCDFNDDLRESTAITTFSNMNHSVVKVCDSYPKGGDTIALLCPLNYTIKPEGCFSKVYVKKEDFENEKNKLEERFNVSRKWEEEKYKIVDIETIFKEPLVTEGDESSKFTKVPVTSEEISFTCICQANNGSDNLMMNVYMNEDYDKFVKTKNDKAEYSKHVSSSTVVKETIEYGGSSFRFFSQLLFLFFLSFFAFN